MVFRIRCKALNALISLHNLLDESLFSYRIIGMKFAQEKTGF
jgi:hypothetical protein